MPPAASARPLTQFSLEHTRLRMKNAPVLDVPSPGSRHRGPRASDHLSPHQNWLPQEAFDLPPERFSRYLDVPVQNLVALLSEAAQRVAVDDVVIVRPIGSVAYARTGDGILWDLVRDLDIWVFLSTDTIRTATWPELHQHLLAALHDVFREHHVWSSRSERTGYLYLRDEDAGRRMVELKLADVNWLREGLGYAHRRRANLIRRPRPAHFEQARQEWAAHTPHENYYATAEGVARLDEVVASISKSEAHYGQQHCFAENLAEAHRALTPARVARSLSNQRLFYRHVRKVLKKQLLLSVMLGNEAAQQHVAGQLDLLTGPGAPGADRAFRKAFLTETVRSLQLLRRTSPDRLTSWLDPDSDRDPLFRPQHPTLIRSAGPARTTRTQAADRAEPRVDLRDTVGTAASGDGAPTADTPAR